MKTFLHVPERRVAEAVRTQRVTFASGPRGPQNNLKIIQGAAELFEQLNGSILGKTVGLVTVGAVEPAGLGLQTKVYFKCYSITSLSFLFQCASIHCLLK